LLAAPEPTRMVETPTRRFGLFALLALLPVLAYLFATGAGIVALAVVNVCIVTAALYTFLGPAAGDPVTH